MAAAAAAGYHLLQLLKCLYLGRAGGVNPCRRSSRALAWVCLLLDKVSPGNSLLVARTPSPFRRKGFIPPFGERIFKLPMEEKKCISCCYIVHAHNRLQRNQIL
jgi:hypothetical protein